MVFTLGAGMSIPCSPEPLRFAEFGRAIVQRNLTESGKTVHYCAFILNEFQANSTALRSMVYTNWDGDSAKSPPKERPGRETADRAAPPELQILAWSQNRPLFPATLVTHFTEGTPEFKKMQEFKAKFDRMFPATVTTVTQTSTPGPARAGGSCDFTVDDGKLPLDITRVIDLPSIPAADFQTPRLDSLLGS